jgi:hypothetical protein
MAGMFGVQHGMPKRKPKVPMAPKVRKAAMHVGGGKHPPGATKAPLVESAVAQALKKWVT